MEAQNYNVSSGSQPPDDTPLFLNDRNFIAENNQQLIVLDHLSRTFDLDAEETKRQLSSKILSSSSVASKYENFIVDSMTDKIKHFSLLEKKIFINQRLNENEKQQLIRLFSPPYKIQFSMNPTDIGSHMFYRALNEIATYRCYDLLDIHEQLPFGYDMLVKEIGASIPKLIKYNRTNVHACTPNLDIDDTIRITNTQFTLDRYINNGSKIQKHLARCYTHNRKYRCFLKSQFCSIKSKYVIFAHSSYNCSLYTMANIMEIANAVKGIGFIHYSSKILSNLEKGYDNGLNWRTIVRNNVMFIQFWFDNDYQNSYVHNLETYLGIIKHSTCTSRKGITYIIQRIENIGGLLFFNILKPIVPIPRSYIMRQIPLESEDTIIVHYYKFQNDDQSFHYGDLIPIKLVVPKKFFEKLYFYLVTLPDGKFTVQNSVLCASTFASRVVINGSYVTQPFNMDIETIENIAYATYFIAYCRRYDLMQALTKLKYYEDIKRNPTFINRLKTIFSSVKNFCFSSNFHQYKNESTIDDVLDNVKLNESFEHKIKYSKNLFQWISRLWRVNNRYNVKFLPITRIVSIEEDIASAQNFITEFPLFIGIPNEEIEDIVRANLKISRVDTNDCVISDYNCTENLFKVHNSFQSHCVFRAICNALNLGYDDFIQNLKDSDRLDVFPTTKSKILHYINSGFSDPLVFELIALTFGINICCHFELVHQIFDTGSHYTYHFEIKDNHCSQLFSKFEFDTFSPSLHMYRPFRIPDFLEKHKLAYRKPSSEKFKLYKYICTDQDNYVNKAFLKLHEINQNFNVLKIGNICELSAAPGSWLQYVAKYFSQSKIMFSYFTHGLDMNITNENFVCVNGSSNGDLSSDETLSVISEEIIKQGKCDVLLSDVAIMKSDEDSVDITKFSDYINKLIVLLPELLLPSGNVVLKNFFTVDSNKLDIQGKSFDQYNDIYEMITSESYQLLSYFEEVHFCKPSNSSPISTEVYLVLKNFDPSHNFLREFSNISTPFLEKVYTNSCALLNNNYIQQIKYTLPSLYSLSSKPDQFIEPNIVEEVNHFVTNDDEPIDEIVQGKTFELEFENTSKLFTFYDTQTIEFLITHAMESDDNPDINITILKNFVCVEGFSQDYYISQNNLLFDIKLTAFDLPNLLSRINYIFSYFHTKNLKYTINVLDLRDDQIEKQILDYVKIVASNNSVLYICNPSSITSNASIPLFQQSIIEYIAYNNLLKSINLTTYKFYWSQWSQLNFRISSTFAENCAKDTQNISLRCGDKYIYKHPKCKADYSHCFNGTDFIPCNLVKDGVYNMVGDFTYRLFIDKIVQKLQTINVNDLEQTKFILIQGVAGHGKTREIVERHKPKLKSSNAPADLLLSPTTAGKNVLIERTNKHIKAENNILNLRNYRTITSFILNGADDDEYLDLYIDEAMMVHTALIIASAYYSKVKNIYLFGDVCQIPFHSSVGDFKFKFNNPISLFNISTIRDKSYRIPADVACTLSPLYEEKHKDFGFNNSTLKTASTVLRSLSIVKINSVTEMLNNYDEKFSYLTFTHTTENELTKLDPRFKPSTIAAFQGSEHKNIAIVRTSCNLADQIYNDINICVTALTRHTKSFVYYTACDTDILSNLISKVLSYTDERIKTFSTSYNLGSVNPISVLMPVKDSLNALKFFVSKQKFSHKFVLLDHERVATEKDFALQCKNIHCDIFVSKKIFSKFNMSVLLKNIKKFSPNTKKIFVKTMNEPFVDNPEIQDIVENYKTANVIQNVVTEHLETVCTPLPIELPNIRNFIFVRPSIEMLQYFMCHLFPHSCFVNTSLDKFFVHHDDINYTLSNVTLAMIKDIYKVNKYDKLRPVLSTPVPQIRDCSQREILLGIQKRNLNPPELILNSAPDRSADHLLDNFVTKLCIVNATKIFADMDPIQPTSASIISWLEKQDRSVLMTIQNDIPFILTSLADCSLSLKRSPKIRITPDAIDVYDSVQTITYHPKFINAYFCSIVDAAQDRLLKILLPYVKFFTKVTTQEFGSICHDTYKIFNKLYLFSGDDSLLISKFKFKEMDMSKFDKSQLLFALEFLCKLFCFLGVPSWTAQLYYEMMYFRICRDPLNKVTMFLTPQMESGSAATYFGNTCFCAAVIASCLDLNTFDYTPRFEKFSLMFNLETKEFNFSNPYFCSKFLVITEDKFLFLPDPVKILIKLGRQDLVNYTHVKEFHTSLLDLVSQYQDESDIEVLSNAVQERYKFPYNCSFHIKNLISVINSFDVFKNLFFSTDHDNIDKQLKRFSDYY
uniref:RNA dependent RNA polymerase n=1 Tax=Xiangshan martelli-like virus 1 TaxID=2886232 RepID=A0A8K1P3G9_9VIRU|nr:MAG: RNA dependent RNA polymerase [Xiangshan martelli-like virus 1]